jgi:hypothetical protein
MALAAAPPVIHPKIGDRDLFHGIQDEMHDITGDYLLQ